MPDESMTSWLIRLADANGVSLQGLCSDIFPHGQIWKTPIDWIVRVSVLRALAIRAHTTVEEVRSRCLEPMTGTMFVNPEVAPGRRPWVMPIASYSMDGGGQMFCTECLAEEGCHYRRTWRLAFATVCLRHDRLLADRCPKCNRAKQFRDRERSFRFRSAMELLVRCTHCGCDLRSRKASTGPSWKKIPPPLWHHAKGLQAKLEEAANTGVANVPGIGPMASNLFFDGVRQILRVLTSAEGVTKFEPVLRSGMGIPEPILPAPRKGHSRQFEHLSVTNRLRLMGVVGWLLEDWPHRFVSTAQSAEALSRILLLEGGDSLPFWLVKVVREHLTLRHARWRDPNRPKAEQISYRALAARKTSTRLAERENRIRYIQAHPELTGDLRALGKAMQKEGLYSAKSDPNGIARFLGKLVEAAALQNEWWRVAGAPISA